MTTPAIINTRPAIIISSTIILLAPEATTWYSSRNAYGSLSIIPTKMISEIPLPIPRSVICSPSHIIKMVPAVISIIHDIVKRTGDTSGETMLTPATFLLFN